MDDFTREDLDRLLDAQGEPLVSVYMPLHPIRSEFQQDVIRLRNLLKDAENRAQRRGMRTPEVKALTAEARALLDEAPFWRSEGKGLAMFIAEGSTRTYRLPMGFDEMLFIDSRYYVKPLLPLVTEGGRFVVLAISQNRVRLLEGDRFRVQEVEVASLPGALAETLGLYDFEKQLQYHATSDPGRPSTDGATISFHGHGANQDDEKERIREHFRRVDSGLRDYLDGRRLPIVLAGVDHTRVLYREASQYPHLLEEGVSGNPDEMRAEDIHEKAWLVVEPYFLAEREQAAERYRSIQNTDTASADLKEVLTAARFGRIDTLFVALDEQRWGRFDPWEGELELADELGPGLEELLDRATTDTIQHGGAAYAIPTEQVPAEAPVAAIMRY